VIGFSFNPPDSAKILPGKTSDILVVSTDATYYVAGNAVIIDGGTQIVAAFQPTSVPNSPPTLTKGFGAANIALNGSTTLSFTLTNPATNPTLTSLSFSDTLPAGLVISTPNGLSGPCASGSITASAGTNVVSFTGGTLAAGANCTFSVNVTGTSVGVKNNTTSTVTDAEGLTGTAATASVTVLAAPTLTKTFSDSILELNFIGTTLSFTISNPGINAVALTGIAFTDTLPVGLSIGFPESGLNTGTCTGATITAPVGGTTVSLSGLTLAAGASCSFSVQVVGTAIGLQINTTSTVTALGGSIVGDTASATVIVQDFFFLFHFSDSSGGGVGH
jgi:hypothetical protein